MAPSKKIKLSQLYNNITSNICECTNDHINYNNHIKKNIKLNCSNLLKSSNTLRSNLRYNSNNNNMEESMDEIQNSYINKHVEEILYAEQEYTFHSQYCEKVVKGTQLFINWCDLYN